jgi:hypothetical protein
MNRPEAVSPLPPRGVAAFTRRTALAGLACSTLGAAAQDFSEAERALFVTRHLADLRPPATLRYLFTQRGTLEENFDDSVTLELAARADGQCCAASAQFLSGPRRIALPEVEAAEGNPVLLYFLERDIREMSRRTKGQANYFRKRIRMAVFQGARARGVQAEYRGAAVAAREFTVTPYADDPLRARFDNLADKQYVFILSQAVPGQVLALRSQVDAKPAGAAPLLIETLTLEGAVAPPG